MTMDAQNRPSLAQSNIGNGTTTVSTDSIDLLTANRNPGRGGPMRMVGYVDTTHVGGTSIQMQLISSAAGALTSPTVLISGPVVLIADAVAGKELLDVQIPDTAQRYLGTQVVNVGNVTAGKVTSGIVANTPRPATEVEMNTGL